MGCCGICMFAAVVSDSKNPSGEHPGRSSYASLDEMSKDFDAVYLVDPKTLKYSDEVSGVAVGISDNSKNATMYLRFLTKYQKFDEDLLRERGHTHYPAVGYKLKSNQLDFSFYWNTAVEGFQPMRVGHTGSYILTDKEKYKKNK